MLILEIMQAGLCWGLILEKELEIRKAFDFFNVELVAAYNSKKVENLMSNAKIVRNFRKINATIKNARAFLNLKLKFGSFSTYIWSFTNGQQIDHKLIKFSDMPSENELSQKISSSLKKHGFLFIGPKIIYSYLQAIGIVNDHHMNCAFRWK